MCYITVWHVELCQPMEKTEINCFLQVSYFFHQLFCFGEDKYSVWSASSAFLVHRKLSYWRCQQLGCGYKACTGELSHLPPDRNLLGFTDVASMALFSCSLEIFVSQGEKGTQDSKSCSDSQDMTSPEAETNNKWLDESQNGSTF